MRSARRKTVIRHRSYFWGGHRCGVLEGTGHSTVTRAVMTELPRRLRCGSGELLQVLLSQLVRWIELLGFFKLSDGALDVALLGERDAELQMSHGVIRFGAPHGLKLHARLSN